MRTKPGAHLSRDGIALARMVGATSPDYHSVTTSTVPRAIETAIAMGFAVDETLEELGTIPDQVMADVGWPRAFAEVAPALAKSTPALAFASALGRLWQTIAANVPIGETGLIVTHGLFIELGTLASLPAMSPHVWGGPIGYCEGVRLSYKDGFQHGEILRVPRQYQLIEN